MSSGIAYRKWSLAPSRSARSFRISQSTRALPGGVTDLPQPDTAAFAGCDGAFVFFLQRTGKDDIRMVSGFGKKEINAAVELQLVESGARAIGIGNGNQRIEADGKQSLDFPCFNGIEDFAGAQTRCAEVRSL